MTIKAGDKIPSVTLKVLGGEGLQDISTEEMFANKKVVLFAVPGAFTPGCSQTHLPGYIVNADKIKAKGVDSIICTAVNDVFVMDAWGKAHNAEELTMLADGNGDFAKALGVTMDGSGWGLGIRSKRFAMIVDNGTVSHLAIEPGAGIDISSAEKILASL